MLEPGGPLELVSTSPTHTRRMGRYLGELLRPGDTVLLEGEFGAGKTMFTQGVGEGIGVREYITSPSFTLVNEYRADPARGGVRLLHVDLYRLHEPAEVVDLGLLEQAGGEGVVVVEWGERIRELLPPEYLRGELAIAGKGRRRFRFTAYGPRHQVLLNQFHEAVRGSEGAGGH